MYLKYILKAVDTGDTITRSKLGKKNLKSLCDWQKYVQRRVLKDQRVRTEHIQAIKAGTVVAAWCNFDELKAAGEDIQALHTYIFSGYDSYFNSYYRKGK